MGRDYYHDLEVRCDATDAEISHAYKKLSLRWHPRLSKDSHETSFHHFCLISEAYEVLSDPVRRAFYDRYGEEKLKEGFFAEGQLKGGYRFKKNPEEIFERFYTDHNEFAKIFDKEVSEERGSMFGHAFGGQLYERKAPPPLLQVEVPCTLNQLYNGCAKKVRYSRKKLNMDGRTTSSSEEEKFLQIIPGVRDGHVILFKQEGHEQCGTLPSDLQFRLKEMPAQHFRREGDDLVYTEVIQLAEAIAGRSRQIFTLDGRRLLVPLDEIVNPDTVKEIKGEGMPVLGTSRKGNLYLKFDIRFPTSLGEDKKRRLREILA